MAGLNDKQERFCQEYVIDLNATQAAIRAGYSKKTADVQGSRLLANVKVASRVEELKAKVNAKLELTQEWVLEHLKEVVAKSMQEKEVEKWDYEEKQLLGTGEYVFDSRGANQALQLIGKHLGMFTDKLDITGKVVYFEGEDKLED